MRRALNIRRMSRSDLDVAVEWAAKEGWNPGLHDADCFYATDPYGFFMAEEDGEPVGFISAVAYGVEFGFVGFFIVRPDCRGGRIGVELGRAALEYLGDRNVGLDGVENKVRNYEQMGFGLVCHNYRYEGTAFSRSGSLDGVMELGAVDKLLVATCDRACFPADRSVFLQHWLSMPESSSLAWMDGKTLKGYGTVRKCRTGYKVGPLFADDEAVADGLYRALLGRLPEASPVYLDIPGNNPAARRLVERYGMKAVFGTARMYNRGEPALHTEKIYGITSFELG